MVQIDQSDTLRVVKEFSEAGRGYQRQFVLWLGIGSSGGIAALLSFSSNLPDPDFALRVLLPALFAFAIGVVFAAATILFLALRDYASAVHYGEAYNRSETGRAIGVMPEFISSPRKLASEMNRERDDLIERNRNAHLRAEAAWSARQRWHVVYIICVAFSVSGFLAGIAWPIGYIGSGGHFAHHAGKGDISPVPCKVRSGGQK